jgi:hypothetical protein
MAAKKKEEYKQQIGLLSNTKDISTTRKTVIFIQTKADIIHKLKETSTKNSFVRKIK